MPNEHNPTLHRLNYKCMYKCTDTLFALYNLFAQVLFLLACMYTNFPTLESC